MNSKARSYAPGNPPEGWIWRHCQDGWMLVPDNQGVHPDHADNINVAFFSGICVLVVLIIAILAISVYLP